MPEPMRAPRWSWKTWAAASFGLVGGYALVLFSASEWVLSDVRATNIASAGDSLMMTTMAAIFGRAGLETWRLLGERRNHSDRRSQDSVEAAE